MKALSIRQPWAWLIVNGHKDVENRIWRCFLGRNSTLLIHASKRLDKEAVQYLRDEMYPFWGEKCPLPEEYDLGGIVGSVIYRGHETSDSRWAGEGQVHWNLAGARVLPFFECKGQLGIFNVTLPEGWGKAA